MYLVISNGYWGRGDTVKEAQTAAAQESGRRINTFLVYESNDPKVYVDEMGYIVHAQGSTLKLISKIKDGVKI